MLQFSLNGANTPFTEYNDYAIMNTKEYAKLNEFIIIMFIFQIKPVLIDYPKEMAPSP